MCGGGVCPHKAITMVEDEEGFRYPEIDQELCIDCGACRRICPYINIPEKNQHKPYVFGGYHKSSGIKDQSTSGGAFSAIAEVFCNENYVVFVLTKPFHFCYSSQVLPEQVCIHHFCITLIKLPE